MDYYVLQVKTGKEAEIIDYIQQATVSAGTQQMHVYFPQRTLYIRKQGIRKKKIEALFPSYLFLAIEEVTPAVYFKLRNIPGFYRFLPNNGNPLPLEQRDLHLLRHFLSFGEITPPSTAYFDENDRICIVEGPLKGLEGKIIKVDKRKGRAKVLLDLYTESFPIDFAFEIIQPIGSLPHKNEVST